VKGWLKQVWCVVCVFGRGAEESDRGVEEEEGGRERRAQKAIYARPTATNICETSRKQRQVDVALAIFRDGKCLTIA